VTDPLAGVVVVVTRPAAQAARFAAMAATAGAHPLLFPTIAIEPLLLDAAARERLAPDHYDWTIYTSANAVEHAASQLPRPQSTRVATVGKGTARALQERGIAVSAVPATTADSEGLLELPCFANLRGQSVLILKGRGGRTLLAGELARRGAEVALGDVYERRRAATDPAALAALRDACAAGRAVIAATSAEVLAALLDLVPEPHCPGLRDAPLVVPGSRVAAAAGDLGWRGRVTAAASAEDAAMLQAVTAAARGSAPGPA
jgi:uroporphyrinogen-III synthase